MFKNNRGFTLLEVIIAIAILAMVVGTLLRTFVFSVKLNKSAYDTDIANALALSKTEEIKENCRGYIGTKDQKTETKYFDIQWNPLGNTDRDEAKFVMETSVERTNSKGRMNSYVENTYMDDDHVHIMLPNEVSIVGLIYESEGSGAKANREYKLDTYSFTEDRRGDIARGIMKWKQDVVDKENSSHYIITKTELATKFRNGLYTYLSALRAPYGENNYRIGKLKSGYMLGDQEEIRGQGVDALKVSDAIPITFLCREDTMDQARTYKIYLVNLSYKDIDVYVQYIRDGSNTSVFSGVQVEVENGMDLIKEEISKYPRSYSLVDEYIFGDEDKKYGNINTMSNYFTQVNNKEVYTIDVNIKRKDDNTVLGNNHTEKYKPDERR